MSENWFFVNEFHVFEDYLSVSEVGCKDIRKGQMDLINEIGEGNYLAAVKAKYDYMTSCLLGSEGIGVMLDKTPRNILFHEYIEKIYGDQGFVYLVRNPFSIASSMLDTWCGGKWYIDEFSIDFVFGLEALLDGWDRYRDQKNYKFLKYEDLVSSPAKEISALADFLDVEVAGVTRDAMLPDIGGALGDKTGVSKYKGFSVDSVSACDEFCSSYVRYCWAIRYYKSNRKFFDTFGYPKPVNGRVSFDYIVRTISDCFDLCVYRFSKLINFNLIGMSARGHGKLR